MTRYLLVVLLALAISLPLPSLSQTARSKAIPVRVIYPTNGQGAILRWAKDPQYRGASIRRRKWGESHELKSTAGAGNRPFFQILNDTTAIDTTYRPGELVEYELTVQSTGTSQYERKGTAAICKDCPMPERRGTMIVVAERMVRDSMPVELEQLKQDLRADGWKVKLLPVSANDPVATIKDSIESIYFADTTNVKHVYLLGHVPVPYSGDLNPDGHTTHRGAWPADGYYVAFDMEWTDQSVSNSGADRAENHNEPGDGKFDQSRIEGHPRLGISRVSMHNLPVFTQANPRMTETFLTRRYLQKAHRYKMGDYTTNRAGIMDDNYNYFNGESFASAGWASMNACIGQNRVFGPPYDLLFDSRTRNWLMGYGCGGGGYEACLDVGNSRNMASDSINVVFIQLFGSYFGDWDSMDNLMRSALGSRGGVLTCSWSGRPWHHYHLMGMGLPYGETARINLFNSQAGGFAANRSYSSVSNGFLGDPSLRLIYFKPPRQPQAVLAGSNVMEVSWQPSLDTVRGYHVYRASFPDTTDFVRLTTSPIRDTVFHDSLTASGRYVYMVRGVQLQAYPAGTYLNQSLGAFTGPVDLVVSAKASLAPTFTLYPNPTQGSVRLRSSEAIQQVQILDGVGRLVLAMPASAETVEADLSALGRGVYAIRVLTGGVWQVKRVVRM